MIVYSDFNKGRLGNQMFFVASTIGIAIKNKTNFGFTSQMGYNIDEYHSLFKKKLPLVDSVPENKFYQNGFQYQDIETKNVELVGYYQSEKFFKHCETIILDQFDINQRFINVCIEQFPNVTNSLSLHIRRGDYLSQPNHHPILPLTYYQTILTEISKNYENIFVFSDDIDWVKNNFIGDNYVFPTFETENVLKSFVLMSMCCDNIISNSTYSWWAAWLNKNKNKKVYSPNHKQWFGTSYSNLDTSDLLPDNWIQILY